MYVHACLCASLSLARSLAHGRQRLSFASLLERYAHPSAEFPNLMQSGRPGATSSGTAMTTDWVVGARHHLSRGELIGPRLPQQQQRTSSSAAHAAFCEFCERDISTRSLLA